MWLFSIPRGYILQQHRFCLLPVQLAASGWDFVSGNQWFQQHNQMWVTLLENNKIVILGLPDLNLHGELLSTRMHMEYLRIINLWTGNNLQWLQRAPIIHMKKEVFLLESNRTNPTLQKSIVCKRLDFNMSYPAILKWSTKKLKIMFLLLYCQ